MLFKIKLIPLLFGLSYVIACSSLKAPTEPIDIRGKVFFISGVIIHTDISSNAEGGRSFSGSGEGKTVNNTMAGGMQDQYKVKFEITKATNGEVTEFRISDVSGYQVIIAEKPVRVKFVLKHPLAFHTIIAKKRGDRWSYTIEGGAKLSKDQIIELKRLESYLFQSQRIVFPNEKVSINHKWVLTGDDFINFYQSFGSAGEFETAREMIEIASPSAELTFKGLRRVDDETCAVIDFTINGKGEMSEEDLVMPFVISGKGRIIRSLTTYKNIQTKHSFSVTGRANTIKEGITLKGSINAVFSGSCKKSFSHKPAPVSQ